MIQFFFWIVTGKSDYVKSLSKSDLPSTVLHPAIGNFQSCKDDETSPRLPEKAPRSPFPSQGRSQYRNFHHHAEKCRCLYLYDKIRDGNALKRPFRIRPKPKPSHTTVCFRRATIRSWQQVLHKAVWNSLLPNTNSERSTRRIPDSKYLPERSRSSNTATSGSPPNRSSSTRKPIGSGSSSPPLEGYDNYQDMLYGNGGKTITYPSASRRTS